MTGRWMAAALVFLWGAAGLSQDPKNGPPKGDSGPKVGDPAPNFKLLPLIPDPKEKKPGVELKSFQGKQPVLLIFGSYT